MTKIKNLKRIFRILEIQTSDLFRVSLALGSHRARPEGLGFRVSRAPRGITLLLVILILTALLSTSVGIFNVVFTELRISGEIADSFVALYAADEAIERGFYEDRDATPLCPLAPGPNCHDSGWVSVPSGACYRLRADKNIINASTTEVALRATGEFRCGSETSVKRALRTDYLLIQ